MKVLISIKPEFVDKIFSGEKIFEFRRRIWARQVKSVVVYSSSPVKKIVGEFVIKKIHRGHPYDIWHLCCYRAGISEASFNEYFKDRREAYAIEIQECRLYQAPLDISEIYGKRPPQSFVYVKD